MMQSTRVRTSTRPTFRPCFESLETRLTPAVYTVSSLADSGDGSLRAAITSANSNPAGSADEIDFSVTGVIKLTSAALPPITNTLNLNGRSAPNFAGVPLLEIENNGFAGLTLEGSNSVLAALSIVNANGAGVTLSGFIYSFGGTSAGQGISVVGNYIGLALDGSRAANTGYGVQTLNSNSTIGGTTVADRNVISGNGAGGICINNGYSGFHSYSPNGAFVVGNFIGTDPTGQSAAPNKGNGVIIVNPGSTVGSTDPGAGNTIAFNTQAGISMAPGSGVVGNSIFANGTRGIDTTGGSFNNSFNSQGVPSPQLSYAKESPGPTPESVQVEIGGVVNIAPPTHYQSFSVICTIQVYATLSGVPAGQGQLFLGSVDVTTDDNGFAAFTLSNLSAPADIGTTFTATVSIPFYYSIKNTSAFSSAIPIGGNPNNLYVASAYGLLLNRYPDPGAAYWVNLMNNGVSAPGVVLSLERSQEYLGNQVAAMYQRYLGRGPDAFGNQAWINFLLAGGTFEQLAAGLAGSQEFYVRAGGTDQGFLTNLYYYALNRGPTTADLISWELALDAGVSRMSVATAFVNSQEYRANLVQADYQTFLKRSADSGGVAAWVNALNAGATDQQVLAQIFGSPEAYQLWS
ncbi:hypothetical protein BH10PLA2_BH10PLA2_12940 [soil metagenome]